VFSDDWSDEDLRKLYFSLEKGLCEHSVLSESEFYSRLPKSRQEPMKYSDQDIFWKLTQAIYFGTGFAANQIERFVIPQASMEFANYSEIAKLSKSDKEAIVKRIGYSRPTRWCISNAKRFVDLIEEYGSFERYIETFSDIEYLAIDLQNRFAGIGKLSSLHFMVMIGLETIKPDRVICRIFYRIGLVLDQNNIQQVRKVATRISNVTGLSSERIDIVLVKYGAKGDSDMLGTSNGICKSTKPLCSQCSISLFCKKVGVDIT